MKNFLFSLFVITFFTVKILAQTPGQLAYYNTDPKLGSQGNAIVSSANGYVLMGMGALPNGSYPFLMSLNPSLQVMAVKEFRNRDYHIHIDGADADTDIVNPLYPTHLLYLSSDDGYVTTGEVDSSATITYSNGVIVGGNVVPRAFLLRTNSQGKILWAMRYGGTNGAFLFFVKTIAVGNNLYAFGSIQQDNTVTHDLCMAKLDANGKLMWIRQIGGAGDDGFGDVVYDDHGSFLLCGGTYSFSSTRKVYALKADTSGNITWSKTYGLTALDYGFSIEKISDNRYMILAYMAGTNTGLMLLKTDASGNLLLAKSLGSSTLDGALRLRKTSDNDLIVTGYSFDGFQYDVLLFKCDTSANVIWSKQIGDNQVYNSHGNPTAMNEIPFDMLLAGNNCFVVGDRDSTFEVDAGPQFHFAKTYLLNADANGGAICNERDYPDFSNDYNVTSSTVTSYSLNATVFSAPYVFKPKNLSFNNRDLCGANLKNESLKSDSEFSICPNPVTSVLNLVTSNGDFNQKQFSLVNSLGQMIINHQFVYNEEVDVSALPEGLYVLIVRDGDSIFSRKILIQH